MYREDLEGEAVPAHALRVMPPKASRSNTLNNEVTRFQPNRRRATARALLFLHSRTRI